MKKMLFCALAILAVVGAGVAAYRFDLVPAWTSGKSTQAPDAGPFCEDHGVPEKFCTICHPEQKDKLLLCPEHGNIPEDICTLCHKDAQQKYGIKLCPKGHGLPEHFCVRCGKEPTASADSLIDDGYCAAIGDPMKADGKPKFCKLLPLVRLASADLSRDIGIQTTHVVEIEHVHELKANAETAYDANRYAEIYPRITGFLRDVHVDLGQTVEAAAIIAVVDSSEVSATKTQYQTADATLHLGDESYRRTKELNDKQIVGSKPLFEAQIAMQQAKTNFLNAEQKLRNLRFDDDALAQILKNNDTKPNLDITTPIKGTVVFRHAVIGEAVESATKLFIVADTAAMWLWIDIYDKDISQVRADQRVRFTVSGMDPADETSFIGRISWVGTELDHITRTIKVRAELPNPGGLLRANQFGTATIEIGERHRAFTVAKSAVQRYDDAELVFIPQAGKTYRPQRIRTKPGGRTDTLEVTWGIKPGQEVVTAGAFLLKTEIMKGSIGAGCCD